MLGVLGERRERADTKFGSDALADADQPVEDMRDSGDSGVALAPSLTQSAAVAYRYIAARRAGGGGVLGTARARGGLLLELGSFDEPAPQELVQQPLALRARNLHSEALGVRQIHSDAICTQRHSGFVRFTQMQSIHLERGAPLLVGRSGSSYTLRFNQMQSDAISGQQCTSSAVRPTRRSSVASNNKLSCARVPRL